MRLLVLVTGEYGWRHVNNIWQHGPPDWDVATWETPKVLPPVLDYPEDYLPESFPPCDLILSLAEVRGVAELIPDIARMTRAQAVIAPIDSVAWLPVGLARQLTEWLDRMGVPCVTPMPFCSLTATHTHALRQRAPYQAHPLIAEFAEHFGQPAFRVTVDEQTRQIVALEVERDACCGCARYVADRLRGTPVDDAIEAGGLHHHHYPCQASMGIEPIYGDTLMHVSGNLMKDALRDALEPYRRTRFVRPTGFVDTSQDKPEDA